MAVNAAARVWGPYKALFQSVDAAVCRHQPDALHDLEVTLRKYKPDFISLLQNPAKNTSHREAVKKAHTEGVTVQGQQAPQILSLSLVEEALTLSDLFNLNEYAAVELLLAAESQQSYFPGWPRGLIAVLLYYDGRSCLVSSLRLLLQARTGRAWSLGLSDDTNALISKFTDQLIAEGLISRILDLIPEVNAAKQISRLQQPEFRALGSPKHRKLVTEKISETQQALADCVFCWSAQTPLGKNDTLRLVGYLRNNEHIGPNGTLTDVSLALMMALLYNMDVTCLEQKNIEEAREQLPLLNEEHGFVSDLHAEIDSSHKWKCPEMKALAQFAWAVTLRTLSQYPIASDLNGYAEQDEALVDSAIESNVFTFLSSAVLSSPSFHKEEHYVRQLHHLITDFISLMPLKIKELRNRGDETARIIMANQQQGIVPPSGLPRHFEQFMDAIGLLYDKNPLGLDLTEDYWCPTENISSMSLHTSTMMSYRPPQKQISLSKFLRTAGDLLSPPLYMPYLRMLRGLATGGQCAHHCFYLLCSNGHTGSPVGSSVSWDHFFTSFHQYYSNLRQEVPGMTSDLAHIYRQPHPRAITPQEIEGLIEVLKLMRRIAEQDNGARVSLSENQQWLPLVVLLGLVSCSIPTSLKAELLLVLAALAKTPEIGLNLWNAIEVAQILPTVCTSSVNNPGGILVELDEVEARSEEFPLTRAFLSLLDTLTDQPLPSTLGIGYRPPGLTPYVDFLRDHVLLKFNTRAYRNPEEKWEVCASVLKILCKLLSRHEVSSEDFVDQVIEVAGEGTAIVNKPPGHTILQHMLNHTPMLRTVLFVIDEAVNRLEKYTTFPGQTELEQSALMCLRLIEATLDRQQACHDTLRESNAAVMLGSMGELLLSTNPRTSQPDHLTNIAKFVTFSSWLSEHAYSAVRIITMASMSSAVQPKIVGLLTTNKVCGRDILSGFVECLEVDDSEKAMSDSQLNEDADDDDNSLPVVRSNTRLAIMRLLNLSLDNPSPNLAHYLLGFELQKPVSKTNLQDAGVLDSPRTCLHALVTILNRGVDTRTGPACLQEMPQLAELAYQLVYKLYANKETCGPTTRYLRTHDLLHRHMLHLPFSSSQTGAGSEPLTLNQMSWLLRTAALELRLTSAHHQRSHIQRLINLLLDDSPTASAKLLQPDGVYEPDYSQYETDFSTFNTSQLQHTMAGGQMRRKLLSILDSIDFCQEPPAPLHLECFNPSLVENIVSASQERSPLCGATVTNVRLVHRHLTAQLNSMTGTSNPHRPHQMMELQDICKAIVERNAYSEAVTSRKSALEGWRQVVEVILAACPPDLLQGEARQCVLLEILQDLLNKVSHEEAVPDLTAPVSGLILSLMANLAHCFITSSQSAHSADGYMSLLDDFSAPSTSQSVYASHGGGARTLFASSLQMVLKGLIEHILRSGSGPQRVRSYLYGALLYFLQIAQKPASATTCTELADEGRIGAKVLSKETEYERLTRENLETLISYGTSLIDVICRDACDGHDVGKMLALACLEVILTMERSGLWLSHMTSQGYLSHLVGGLQGDNEQLQSMLQPQPPPLKALFIFQSKISLLTRVAQSSVGASSLLQIGLPLGLSRCSVLDMRPDIDRDDLGEFVPSALTRYRQQILFPVLRLCLAILTTLGAENVNAARQILKVVISHADVVHAILRGPRAASPPLEALQELMLTTALVSKAAVDNTPEESSLTDASSLEFSGLVTRLQRQMIALLPRYCLSQKMLRHNKATQLESDKTDQASEILVTMETITAHIVAFCQSIVLQSGVSPKYYRVLFAPYLTEALTRDYMASDDLQLSNAGSASRPQNLGLVAAVLQQAVTLFLSAWDSHKQYNRQLENIPHLTSEELKELCSTSGSEKLSSQQKQNLATARLSKFMSYKAQEISHLMFIVENCLLLLWRHLEYYLIHCTVADQGATLFKLNVSKQQQMRRMHDPSSPAPFADQDETSEDQSDALDYGLQVGGISRDDLEQLKSDLRLAVNENLFRKLLDIEQCYARSKTHYGFLGALVRRIKRLIQLHASS